MSRIYLDHNATTPLREEVVEAMARALRDEYGNPSSIHSEGSTARRAIDDARECVAALIGASASEIFFTAGATEANNTVLKGLLGPGSRIVTTSVEHPSVEAPLAYLEERGVVVSRLSVDCDGEIDLDALKAALDVDTTLVSILWANNETGVIQSMDSISQVVKDRGVPLHVDATQAIGKSHVSVKDIEADFLSSSAHKLNGPKGVGYLMMKKTLVADPLIMGGGQEGGWRGGTENVAGIVGFGKACELAGAELEERIETYADLRDRLWAGIEASIDGVRRNGSTRNVLTNSLNVEFAGAAGEVLVQSLDLEGVAVSAGAACHSGSISASRVLTEMGLTPDQARSSLRLSVGHGLDARQIDRVVELLGELVPRARVSAEA